MSAPPRIVLTDPAPLPKTDRCPQCRSGKESRVRSGGFGVAHPVCSQCGYEWVDEVWTEAGVSNG